eukprot:gene5432-biopygen13158
MHNLRFTKIVYLNLQWGAHKPTDERNALRQTRGRAFHGANRTASRSGEGNQCHSPTRGDVHIHLPCRIEISLIDFIYNMGSAASIPARFRSLHYNSIQFLVHSCHEEGVRDRNQLESKLPIPRFARDRHD